LECRFIVAGWRGFLLLKTQTEKQTGRRVAIIQEGNKPVRHAITGGQPRDGFPRLTVGPFQLRRSEAWFIVRQTHESNEIID
jgi:hypothetical protein